MQTNAEFRFFLLLRLHFISKIAGSKFAYRKPPRQWNPVKCNDTGSDTGKYKTL